MKKHPTLHQAGLSLVELMVAMAIGLILMLGATGVLLTNQQAFNTTSGLSSIQDSSRIAIDMLSRQIREAGSHPCKGMAFDPAAGSAATMLGLLNQGIDINSGDNPGNRDTAQAAINLITVDNTQTITAQSGNVFTVKNELASGDSILVCGGEKQTASILTVSAANSNSVTTSSAPPGSQSKYTGATLSSGLMTQLWYIGTNADGRPNSLYRSTNGGNPEEMVDGVIGLTIAAQGTNGLKLDLIVCSRDADVRGLTANNAQECGPGRIQRTVSTIIQRRAA